MAQPFPGFLGASYQAQSPILDCEDLINLMIERSESAGAKAPACLLPTPGALRFGGVAQTNGKAFFSTAASGGRTFSVTGTRLYEWLEDGSAIERGTVAAGSDPATITTNGDGGQQLLITAGVSMGVGGNVYSYDLIANTLTQVATLNGLATMGGFAYGYGLIFDRATGTVYLSDLFDFSVFDPTQFFQRTIGSDDWNAMYVTSWGQIFLPGTKTRDYWYNAGTFPIPFAPAQSGLQSDGIAATFAVIEAGGTIAWLSTNTEGGYEVLAAEGYRSKRISTHAIEDALAGYSRIDDCIATAYKDRGHPYLLLKFPSADVTWCYDFSIGMWHKRSTLRRDGTDGAWHLTFHCFAFNKHLWLDSETGNAYQTDISFAYDVDSRPIRRTRVTPSICFNHEMLSVGQFELLMQVGVGNPNAPAVAPQVILQMSYDGGMTWGRERACSAGRIGEYLTRVRWQGNGAGRDVAFKIVMSDPIVNWRIVNAFIQVSDPRGRMVPLARAA
jgi:hypothetical protein